MRQQSVLTVLRVGHAAEGRGLIKAVETSRIGVLRSFEAIAEFSESTNAEGRCHLANSQKNRTNKSIDISDTNSEGGGYAYGTACREPQAA